MWLWVEIDIFTLETSFYVWDFTATILVYPDSFNQWPSCDTDQGQLWEEGPYCAFDQASADGALPQWRCTLFAHHQMSARDEDDVHFFIHTHLTGTLLLQATQLLLHGEVWKWIKIQNDLNINIF